MANNTNKITFIIFKTGADNGLDISDLIESITWSGRRGTPTRTITIKILDDDGYGHTRGGIEIENGYQCIFKYDGVELFRGIFLKQKQSNGKTAEYKAYDLGIYLSNNKDTFTYENKTATEIFTDVCSRFGIPIGGASQTSYIIPDLTKKKTTGWDTIADALSLDYENTEEKHYIYSEEGYIYLKRRLDNILQWVLETDTNITGYTYNKSLESVKTRIKLLSSEGTVLAQSQNTALEKKIGIFQEVQTTDESLTEAQLKALAKSLLKEKSAIDESLTLNNVIGISDVISGIAVFVNIPHLNLNRVFYVDSDTHTFQGNLHTMSLDLNPVSETGASSTSSSSSSTSSTSSSSSSSSSDTTDNSEEIQKLLKQIETLEKQIKELQQQIEELEENNNDNSDAETIAELQQQIEELQAQIEELETQASYYPQAQTESEIILFCAGAVGDSSTATQTEKADNGLSADAGLLDGVTL